jgi:hypothetical protein
MNATDWVYLTDAGEAINLAMATKIRFSGSTAFVMFSDSTADALTTSRADLLTLIHALGRLTNEKTAQAMKERLTAREVAP